MVPFQAMPLWVQSQLEKFSVFPNLSKRKLSSMFHLLFPSSQLIIIIESVNHFVTKMGKVFPGRMDVKRSDKMEVCRIPLAGLTLDDRTQSHNKHSKEE